MLFRSAVVSLGALQWLLYRTALGRAFRATSDDAATAELMGIDNRHLYALAMAIALGFTALSAGLFAIRSTFDPSSGPINLIFAFEAVIIGGLGNIPGAVVAAIGLGLIESWIGGFFTIAWQEAAVFVIMIFVLFVRPDGLFKRGGMRVG